MSRTKISKTKFEIPKKKPYYIKEPYGLPFELTEAGKYRQPKMSRTESTARRLMDGKLPTQKRISTLYYHILEDANFHKENERLTELGYYGDYDTRVHEDGTQTHTPKDYAGTRDAYHQYIKAGGKTWEL